MCIGGFQEPCSGGKTLHAESEIQQFGAEREARRPRTRHPSDS